MISFSIKYTDLFEFLRILRTLAISLSIPIFCSEKSYAILSTNLRRNNCWDRSKGTFKQHETHVTINAIERILTNILATN